MDFNKILLVLKREYLTRVRTKAFILSTLLTPIALVGLMAVVIAIALSDSDVVKTIGIVDNSGSLYERLEERNAERYVDVSHQEIDSIRAHVLSEELNGYIILEDSFIETGESPTLIYSGSGGIAFIESVEDDLQDVVRDERLSRSNVSDEVRKIFEARPQLESLRLTEQGEEEDNAAFGAAFGFILGILIFVGLFGYGAVLMRSVIEEKTNRIVEVIASSVKPIELMLGKLMGICVLALTQFIIWIGTYMILTVAATPVIALFLGDDINELSGSATGTAAASGFDPAMIEQFQVDPVVFVYFILFFFIGFLIYSSIFAAIGAAVDNEQDTQQFMIPVMLPIFLGYMLNMKVIEDPDSTFAVFASLFPLTAPINMISRIAATNVPFWEIALSVVLMTGTFAGIMWLAAKIYRVGILMYGKKPSYKELAKWIRQS